MISTDQNQLIEPVRNHRNGVMTEKSRGGMNTEPEASQELDIVSYLRDTLDWFNGNIESFQQHNVIMRRIGFVDKLQ